MRCLRCNDHDRVARCHPAAGDDDAHHPGEADEVAVAIAVEDRALEAILQAVELKARSAQAGEPYDGLWPEVQQGAGGQCQQIEAARRDVLAHASRLDREPVELKAVVQLCVDEVHLRRFGWLGSRATRLRCLTVTPECTSPSTPLPASRVILATTGLLIV